jgi:hypothetical protein
MPRELFFVLVVLISSVSAYIAAKVTGRSLLRTAKINADKDIYLQDERLLDERIKSEVSMERGKLERIHLILSAISLENSLTVSYIQSDSDMPIDKYRDRYLENCSKLHEAMAISDIYYQDMSGLIEKIYCKSNLFWGSQEGVLRTNIKEERQAWNQHLQKTLKIGEEISDHVRRVQSKISERSAELSKKLRQKSE